MDKLIWALIFFAISVNSAIAQVTPGTVFSKTEDGNGNKITSTVTGPSRGLDINCLAGCAGGGGGGTSSTFGAAFPATGTAAGFSDGTPNMRQGFAVDTDTGVGTIFAQGVNLISRANGGPIEIGVVANPLRTDPTGTTIQPVSGTVIATQSGVWNIGTLTSITNPVAVTGTFFQGTQPVSGTVAVSNAFLLDATFTGRWTAATLDVDAIVNETTTSVHGKCYLYNGASWDRCRGAIATGLLVNVSNASLAVTQSGTWNINNISGTISLPTGASTEATLATRLADATFTGRINTLGQKAMASSTPVVLASDQTSIPVAATVSNSFLLDATFTGRLPVAFASADGIAAQTSTFIHGGLMGWNAATSKWDRLRLDASDNLNVNINANSFGTLTVAGTVTANQGGSPWQVQSNSLNLATQATVATLLLDATFTGRINTQGQKTMAASTPVVLPSDQAAIPVTLTSTTITGTVTVQGAKTNNNAAPGATNVGVLPCVANAVAPVYIEGNQVGCSTDLVGNTRTITIPQSQSVNALLFVGLSTASQALLASSTIRQSFRVSNQSNAALCVTLSAIATLNNCVIVVQPGQMYVGESNIAYRGAVSGRWVSSGIGEAIITDIPGG